MTAQLVNAITDKEKLKCIRKRKLKRGLFMGSFLLLPIINFFVFYVYINLDAFVMAFQKELPGGNIEWTFDHFSTVWQSITGKVVRARVISA